MPKPRMLLLLLLKPEIITDLMFVPLPRLLLHAPAGYYPAGSPPKSNQQAQIDMIDEVLRWAGVKTVDKVCLPYTLMGGGELT
jgi:hypothetical protein